jgi:hypothetical protein
MGTMTSINWFHFIYQKQNSRETKGTDSLYTKPKQFGDFFHLFLIPIFILYPSGWINPTDYICAAGVAAEKFAAEDPNS